MYWQKRLDREDPDKEIEEKILFIRVTNKDYGYRRVLAELRNQGYVVNKKKVQRIMQKLGLQVTSFTRKSRKYSSYKGQVGTVAPNRIRRRFKTHIPHQKITTDTTEFKYYEIDAKGHMTMRKLYLDPFMDMCNGEIISYGIAKQPSAQNIMNGHRCMLYSGELTDFNVLQWFMRAVANPSDLQEFKGKVGSYYDVTSHGEYSIRQWIKNKLFIYSEDSSSSVDNISVSIEYLARTKDVKLFVLDNMMTVDDSGLEELDKQKRLAKKLKSLARKYRICIILVAHPKKKGDKDKYHMHDVSGASEVVNLADYELILTRNIKVDSKTNDVSDITKIGILKNRTTGKQGISRRLNFDDMRKRFWIDDRDKIKDYGYDKVDQVSFVELDDVANDVPF